MVQVTEYATSDMMEVVSTRTERRRAWRQTLQIAADMSFYNKGALYRASLVDLSSGGARLQFSLGGTADTMPTLHRGRKMECYISTPEGRTKCRGTVQWTCRTDDRMLWGISFIELSPDGNDPLRNAIADVYRYRGAAPVTGMAQY
ncbi:MAG: PilZ domain-containing protein [Chitinispirillaceae bacterium]|nr:PilZ domain-containing protein [Chitinispirillaceae bacterium]